MKRALSFLVSAVSHSPKGRQKTEPGVGVRNRAAVGVGTVGSEPCYSVA